MQSEIEQQFQVPWTSCGLQALLNGVNGTQSTVQQVNPRQAKSSMPQHQSSTFNQPQALPVAASTDPHLCQQPRSKIPVQHGPASLAKENEHQAIRVDEPYPASMSTVTACNIHDSTEPEAEGRAEPCKADAAFRKGTCHAKSTATQL